MEKNIISDIYNGTIGNVLADVGPQEINVLQDAYRNYLQERYGTLSINANNYNRIVNIYIKTENDKWLSASIDDKKAYLFEDTNLSELAKLSGQAEDHARTRINSGATIPPEVATSLIANMKSYCNNVQDFNKKLATQYLSEGSVDCYFASGQSDNISIRLSKEVEGRIIL